MEGLQVVSGQRLSRNIAVGVADNMQYPSLYSAPTFDKRTDVFFFFGHDSLQTIN